MTAIITEEDIKAVWDFVARHSVMGTRGEEGVVDTIFLPVKLTKYAEEHRDLLREEFVALVKPFGLLDGVSHGYITWGAALGASRTALIAMGVGDLLGVWDILTPLTADPDMPEEQARLLAKRGHVGIISLGGRKLAQSDFLFLNKLFLEDITEAA